MIANKTQRRKCTCCNRKIYCKKMKYIYYPLLKLYAWHCNNCLSQIQDNLQNLPENKTKSFLELFSGSRLISSIAAGEYQYKTFTIDIEPKYKPALCANIQYLRLNQIPQRNKIFLVWASLPCTYYTILNLSNHWKKLPYSFRNYYYIPLSSEAKASIRLLEKTLWLIRKINPVYYFIENPRGALRHMAQMKSIPFLHTVSYNDYGAGIYKPTDIFTNMPGLHLRKLAGSVRKTFPQSVAKMNNSFNRSLVPSELIHEILHQIEVRHFH